MSARCRCGKPEPREVTPGWAAAAAILAKLPPEDPYEILRRRAVLVGNDRYPTGTPLAPYRTRAEARWSDEQLRKAHALYRSGVRSRNVVDASDAYRRIMARRSRAARMIVART